MLTFNNEREELTRKVAKGNAINGSEGIAMKRKHEVLTNVTRPRLPLTYHRSELYCLPGEFNATRLNLINGLPGPGKSDLISSYIVSRDIRSRFKALKGVIDAIFVT